MLFVRTVENALCCATFLLQNGMVFIKALTISTVIFITGQMGVYQYMRTLERALNAGCMLNGYQPVTFKELIENNERYKDNLE